VRLPPTDLCTVPDMISHPWPPLVRPALSRSAGPLLNAYHKAEGVHVGLPCSFLHVIQVSYTLLSHPTSPLAETGCPMSRAQERRTNRECLYRPLPAAWMA
jgi:hypothetical protein